MKNISNRKGFTLTELLATIVILVVLISISAMVYINVRKRILQKDYENLVVYLETKGSEYAEDTGIIRISVKDLIDEGYIKPDDETDIYDPRDNTSMNCYLLDMKYVDGKYEAKLGENLGFASEGVCNTYTKETEVSICYFQDNDCKKVDENKWFNTNIKLGVKFRDNLLQEGDAQFKWIANTGFTSEEATLETNVNSVGRITYSCNIIYNEKVGNTSVVVNIDREFPVVTDINVEDSWKTNNDIEIIATDKSGSGIEGYAILSDDKCGSYQTSNKFNVTANGTYKICVKDKAGNESKDNSVTVSKIDTNPPSCNISVSNTKVSLNVSDDNGVDSYDLTKSSIPTYNNSVSVNLSNGTFYGYVKDYAGNINSCSREIFATKSYTTYYCPSGYSKCSSDYDCDCYKTTNATYKSSSSCPSGYSACSSNCSCYKAVAASPVYCYTKSVWTCKSTGSTYTWGTGSSTHWAGSCTAKNQGISCNMYTVGYQKIGCARNNNICSYYCSSGTKYDKYCYFYARKNTSSWYECSSGTLYGAYCYHYADFNSYVTYYCSEGTKINDNYCYK